MSHLAGTDNQHQAGLLTPGGERTDLPGFPRLAGASVATSIEGRSWGFPVIGRKFARYSGASVAGFHRLPFSSGTMPDTCCVQRR